MVNKMPRMNERDFKIILPVAEQAVIDKAAIKMSKQFGGVTMQPLVRGLWLDDKGKLVKDDNILLFSSRDLTGVPRKRQVLIKDRKFMKELAHEFGRKLKQDAVWIEEDIVRDIQFIEPQRQRLRRMV